MCLMPACEQVTQGARCGKKGTSAPLTHLPVALIPNREPVDRLI